MTTAAVILVSAALFVVLAVLARWSQSRTRETRIWITTSSGGQRSMRIQPVERPGAAVTVRRSGEGIPFDGIWIDGQRSYDTWVMIDGEEAYHAPSLRLAAATFDLHERRGGGQPI